MTGQQKLNMRGGDEKEQNKTHKITLTGVGAQGKAQRIGSTFWDSIGVVGFLALLCLLHLHWVQVAVRQLGMKTLGNRWTGS